MKRSVVIGIIILLFLVPMASPGAGFFLKSAGGTYQVTDCRTYHYVSFDWLKPGWFSLYTPVPVRSAEIEPGRLSIPFKKEGNRLEFRLDKPCYLVIRLNDSLKIFLFAEKPEQIPSGKDVVDFRERYHPDPTGLATETQKIQQALDDISGTGKTLYFPPGLYKSGQLRIRSNSRIYLARGAEIMANTDSVESYAPRDDLKIRRFMYIGGAENVTLGGYGSINGNGRILRGKYGDDARIRLILAARSRNILIGGLLLKDPGSWNTHVILCQDVTLSYLKILNDQEISNTDGFDPDGVRSMVIRDCFACCGDDNVAVKTTGSSGLLDDVDGVTVKNCLFLTRKSALKVGTETRGKVMKNIDFTDNDVVECDRGISLYVSDGAKLDSIRYSGNRFGRNYPDLQRKAIHILVNRRDSLSKLGSIDHLLISDCRFQYPFPRKSVIQYGGEGTGIWGIIESLTVGSVNADTPEKAGIEIKKSSITFK